MKEKLTFDKKSARRYDENGFLFIDICPISKETVNEYHGREIPGWQEAGLEPQKIYKGYRAGVELSRGADTFNGLNILSEHIMDDAEDPPKEYIVGSMGTDAIFSAPYLKNSLIIKDADAIAALDGPNPKKEISASYRYDPVFTAGTFNGQRYDFIMTNIRGNHIALVEEGRAGSDVVVSDENTIKKGGAGRMKISPEEFRRFIGELNSMVDQLAGAAKHEGGMEEAEEALSGELFDDDESAEDETETQRLRGERDDLREEVERDDLPVDDEGEEEEIVKRVRTIVAEMYAAIDNITDQEQADAMRGILDGLKEALGIVDEAATDEERVIEKEKEKEVTAMDRARKARKRLPAMDVKSIEKRITRNMQNKVIAARDVKPLIGEVDPLAFDSAAGLYRYALGRVGRKTEVSDVRALREIVKAACELKTAGRRAEYPVFAQDSARGEMHPDFKRFEELRNK